MRRSLSQILVPASTILAIVLLTTIGFLSVRTNVHLVEAAEAHARTYRVTLDLTEMIRTLEEAETRERGFLLTGDSARLVGFAAAVMRTERSLDELRDSLAGGPFATPFANLERVVRDRLVLLQSVLSIRELHGPDSARAAIQRGEGTERMNEARSIVQRMLASQVADLADRDRIIAREARNSRITLAGGIAGSILLVGFAFILLQRQFAQRQSIETELAEANEELTAQNRALLESRTMLDREKSLVESVLMSAGDGVVLYGSDGAIQRANPAARRLLGLGADAPLPPTLRDSFAIFRSDGTTAVAAGESPGEQALRGEEIAEVELQLVPNAGGTARWLSITAQPIRDELGEIEGAVIVLRDAALRRRTLDELRRARDVARDASHAKTRFLANMSHEMRTPLNGVIGMLDLALQTNDAEQLRRYLNVAMQAANSLIEIINDVLDLSRIEAGRIDIEQIGFLLHHAVDDTLSAFTPQARQKRLSLAWQIAEDVPDAVTGDPGRLRQIIRNLVANAIKFTSDGSVRVRVDVAEVRNDIVDIEFTVVDTGIGIPPDKRRTIFEPFTQADVSTTRKYGGTGLGLSIVAQLVGLMGGRVRVESEIGRGSAFHVLLPFSTVVATPVLDRDATDLHELRALIVDDNEITRAVLQGIFASWQMRAEAVESGSEALARMRQGVRDDSPYDLVIADRRMPGMDGFALTERIRADVSLADTIIIVLATGGERGDGARCRTLGVAAYLTKPVRQSELLDAIVTARGLRTTQMRESFLITRHSLRETRRSLKVLVAEDNEFNEMVTRSMLTRWGHTVITSWNGRDTVERARKETFDLILMDVQMPELDGLDATRAIRAAERDTDRHVPIIAMTAHAMTGDREACIAAGMDDYVPKPIRSADLLAAILRTVPPAGIARVLPAVDAPRAAPAPEPDGLLDRGALLAEAGGDAKLLGRMVAKFRIQANSLMVDIRAAIRRQDANALSAAAHSLKGAVGYWVQGGAFRAARALEHGASAGRLDHAPEHFAVLERELARLDRELERL